MLRQAKRTLSGHVPGGDHDIRYGQHVDGGPAVTVDLCGWNESRTYKDAADLRRLGIELIQAANWLYAAQLQRMDGRA